MNDNSATAGGESSNSQAPTSTDNKSGEGRSRRRRRGGRNRRRGDNGRGENRAKPTVDHSAWDISQFEVPPEEGKLRFHDLDLPSELMHAIADQGFSYCSPIQARSLPFSLRAHDVVGKAQTGTGKTAAFLVTIISELLNHTVDDERYAGEARALIIAPTRELVMQIADDARALCAYTDLQVHTLVGGMDYDKQKRRLHSNLCDILVATPGRLLDFSGSRDVYLDRVEILVLDEADRMLDMGFIPQVRRIVRLTPHRDNRHTLFFSATFTQDVINLAEQWTVDPVSVEIEPESVATDTVDQKVYITAAEDKFNLLYNVIRQDDVESIIVFANRRDQCRRLEEKLKAKGFTVGLLSGDVPQNKRVRTLDDFKSGRTKILVATDVAGRGIHIDGISHVVNYTLPEEAEDYVHRIGRTGRAGKSGTSISFACEDDAFLLEPIQTLLGKKLDCEQPADELLRVDD